jgi:drug/metabolite transporter (DMT)-like permease
VNTAQPTAKPISRLSPVTSAFISLGILALIWGYSWPAMKVGTHYAQPFTFAAMRALVGAVLMIAILPLAGRSLRPTAVAWTALLGLFQTTGFLGLTMWALQSGGAGKTSVLVYTMPFWLLLMAWTFLQERVRGAQWAAVGLALVGLVLVLSPWRLHGIASSLMAVGAGFSWAASCIVMKMMRRRFQVDALSVTSWQMLFGALPLLVIGGLTADRSPVWTGSFIAAFVYLVIPASGVAWVLWAYITKSLPTGTVGVGSLIIPVIGVASSWIQLGERPSVTEAVGIPLIVAALAIVSLRDTFGGRRHGLSSTTQEATP